MPDSTFFDPSQQGAPGSTQGPIGPGPMPSYGFDGMYQMDPQAVEQQRRQQEEESRRRKQEEDKQRGIQAKNFKDQYVNQLGQEASKKSADIVRSQGKTPVSWDLDLGDSGVRSAGVGLNIPLSERIGFNVGGSYIPGQQTNQNIMGQDITIKAPNQFAGQLEYNSPFMKGRVTYTPGSRQGFSGSADINARW